MTVKSYVRKREGTVLFPNVSDQEQERLKELINQLLGVNFLLKELDREKFLLARRHREALTNYFRFLGWELVLDDRHECIALISPRMEHRRRLKREESIWLLVLRLIYQEKRQGLSLSDYPVTTLYEIRTKYQTFRLPFVKQTQLKQLVAFCKKYNLIDILDADITSDDCRFLLYHTLLHVIETERVEELTEKIRRYERGEEGVFDEVDEEAETD
jgi:hypothetical protein